MPSSTLVATPIQDKPRPSRCNALSINKALRYLTKLALFQHLTRVGANTSVDFHKAECHNDPAQGRTISITSGRLTITHNAEFKQTDEIILSSILKGSLNLTYQFNTGTLFRTPIQSTNWTQIEARLFPKAQASQLIVSLSSINQANIDQFSLSKQNRLLTPDNLMNQLFAYLKKTTNDTTCSSSQKDTNPPTKRLTNQPTLRPTNQPSNVLTNRPSSTLSPSHHPTRIPTKRLTNRPTLQPTNDPTSKPSPCPPNNDSIQATIQLTGSHRKTPNGNAYILFTKQQANPTSLIASFDYCPEQFDSKRTVTLYLRSNKPNRALINVIQKNDRNERISISKPDSIPLPQTMTKIQLTVSALVEAKTIEIHIKQDDPLTPLIIRKDITSTPYNSPLEQSDTTPPSEQTQATPPSLQPTTRIPSEPAISTQKPTPIQSRSQSILASYQSKFKLNQLRVVSGTNPLNRYIRFDSTESRLSLFIPLAKAISASTLTLDIKSTTPSAFIQFDSNGQFVTYPLTMDSNWREHAFKLPNGISSVSLTIGRKSTSQDLFVLRSISLTSDSQDITPPNLFNSILNAVNQASYTQKEIEQSQPSNNPNPFITHQQQPTMTATIGNLNPQQNDFNPNYPNINPFPLITSQPNTQNPLISRANQPAYTTQANLFNPRSSSIASSGIKQPIATTNQQQAKTQPITYPIDYANHASNKPSQLPSPTDSNPFYTPLTWPGQQIPLDQPSFVTQPVNMPLPQSSQPTSNEVSNNPAVLFPDNQNPIYPEYNYPIG